MKWSMSNAAPYALFMLLMASASQAQTPAQPALTAITTLACYQDIKPLQYDADSKYATDGWCQTQCGGKNHSVMAMTGGSSCYCGDIIPSPDKQVPDSNCNTKCNGYGDFFCGGIGYYQLYLTGLTGNVKTADNGTDAIAASDTASASPSVVTEAGQTVVVTAGGNPSNNNKGPNKVGIAVGVVIGLIVLGTAVGAIIFLLRQRRRRAIEEEHKRNAAISEIVNSKKSEGGSISDSRLDHSFLSSHRRESIGSIADEMDFSRRILQVRNPDHRASNASNLA